jgi:pimeloyl-[acyl-carrier protein] methyl ester esterase
MNSLCFVFCHGFGFDATYWQAMRQHCQPHPVWCMDLGYGGATQHVMKDNLREGACVIGIGHSLGFSKLLQSGLPFDYLIGLNAFRNFLGFDAKLASKRARELAQLSTRLTRSAQHGLALFYQRTGVPAPVNHWQTVNQAQLLADLSALAYPVSDLPDIKQLILASVDDPVVPPELVWDNFAACPHVTVEILPNGQHALGYRESSLVMQRIMSFINAN